MQGRRITDGGRELRAHIDELGISVPDFCDRHDLERLQVQRVLNGERWQRISVDFAAAIEKATGGRREVAKLFELHGNGDASGQEGGVMARIRKDSATAAPVIAAPLLSDDARAKHLAHADVSTSPRAKRIGGGKILAVSYPAARAFVADALTRAVREHGLSEERVASAAGVSRSLVHAYLDAESPQKPRLDILVCIAEHGGAEARRAVEQLLVEVLEHVRSAGMSTSARDGH